MWGSLIAAIFIVNGYDNAKENLKDPQRRENIVVGWKYIVLPIFVFFIGFYILNNLVTAAIGQTSQHTFRDSSGRTMGRSVTDTKGNTNYYDSMGRTTGRSSTDSRGNVTIYNERGQQTGRISK